MGSSRKDSFTLQALQVFDAILVWIAFLLANAMRETIQRYLLVSNLETNGLDAMTWVLYVAVPFTPLVLERFGFYKRTRKKKLKIAVWQLIQTLFVIGVLISFFAIFAKLEDTRRLILGFGAIFMFLLILFRERVTRSWMRSRNQNGSTKERVIIAGSDKNIDNFLSDLDAETLSHWQIVARFDVAKRDPKELFELLKKESVGQVIFAAKDTPFEKVGQAIEVCELQGVEAWISASFISTQIARPVFDSISSKPMLVLRSTPELSWELLAKEVIDRTLSFTAILCSLPLWIFAAIGIKISSPGSPVMFCQMRAGRYGRPFKMWKFRTMVPNAEELLQKMKEEHGNQMDGPVFKLDNDPRIFSFGSFLRRTSIDELPQLLNVLRGDMSLVGPRPLPLYEVEAFGEISHRRRLSVKPGITCEWQATGRNKITSFDDWVKMDLRYIDNWSLWLDFQILFLTIPAVLFGRGAK